MKNKKLNLDSVITAGKYKGKTVSQIVEENRKEILSLYKKGYDFEEEVFEKARYKHIIRDEKVFCEIVTRDSPKKIKTFKKDTANISKIIEELSTIDRTSSYDDEDVHENIYNNFD